MADMNRNLVVNMLRTHPTMSRADLVRATRLSGPTVSSIVADLTVRGLVEEVGQGVSSGGRPPSLLRLNDKANYVIGLKLMGHAISLVVTDLRAGVLYTQVTPLPERAAATAGPTAPPAHREPEVVIAAIHEAIQTAISSSGVAPGRIIGVGVGVAGAVDATTGVCRFSNTFSWHNVALAQPLSERLGLPVILENDANTLTAAEQWFGLGHGVDHFIVIVVGSGIGAGIVVNGQLHRGAQGAAGEFGHIQLGDDGPPCTCGRNGCVEAWASDRAILRDIRAAVSAGTPTSLRDASEGGELTIAQVGAAADQGDELSRGVLTRAGDHLGRGVAAIVNVINPRLVVISGEGVPAGEWRFGPVRKAIAASTFAETDPEVVLVSEPVDGAKWARGAACVVLGETFNPPTKQSLVDVM
ncbi:MAG: ROK family transcriptional regulator [Acidimicrobiales bacterium]